MIALSRNASIIMAISFLFYACASKPRAVFVRSHDNSQEIRSQDLKNCGNEEYKEDSNRLLSCGRSIHCEEERAKWKVDLILINRCMLDQGWDVITIDSEEYDRTYGQDPKTYSRPYEPQSDHSIETKCLLCSMIKDICDSTVLTNDQKGKLNLNCAEEVPPCLSHC